MALLNEYLLKWHFLEGQIGWREYWYMPKTTFAAAYDLQTPVMEAREFLCGTSAYIEGVTLIDMDTGQSQTTDLSAGEGFSQVDTDTDYPRTAILCRFTNTQFGYARSVYLRGVPDFWVGIDNASGLNYLNLDLIPGAPLQPQIAVFNAAFQEFATLASKVFQMKVLLRPGDLGVTPNTITAMAVNPDFTVTVTTATNHGLAPQQLVRIKGALGPGTDAVKGLWRVTVTGLTTFVIQAQALPTLAYEGKGTVMPQVYGFRNFDTWVSQRYTTKKTGKASFGTRGRAPKRKPLPCK